MLLHSVLSFADPCLIVANPTSLSPPVRERGEKKLIFNHQTFFFNKGYFLTRRLEFFVALKVSNIEVMSLPITCGHHFTGRAVGLIHADFLGEGLANREVNRAIGDISPRISPWNDAFFFRKGNIPVQGAIVCV